MRGLCWQQPSLEVEEAVVVQATPAVRREIVITPSPLAQMVPIGGKKPGTISLAAPSTPPLLLPSAASARITLKGATRSAARPAAVSDVPPVKLYDHGNGTFAIDIA